MPALVRKYSAAHRKRRAQLLPYAIGTLCPCGQSGCTHKCDGLMLYPNRIDLDHTLAVVLGGGEVGDRLICSACNRSAGATLGNRLRRPRASRNW